MKLFELYSPFLSALQNQLGVEFLKRLPEQNIFLAYNNHMLSESKLMGAKSTVYKDSMLSEIQNQKNDIPFKATYYLAWILLVVSFLPLQAKGSGFFRADYQLFPAPVFTGFCEVNYFYKAAAALFIISSYAANLPLLSKVYMRIIFLMIIIGALIQILAVYLHPTVTNFIIVGTSWLIKLLIIFFSSRFYGECQTGCTGNFTDHIHAFETEVMNRAKESHFNENANRSMTDVNNIQNFRI